MEDTNLLQFRKREELREWLIQNHSTAHNCWDSNITFQRASARHYPLQRNCRGGIMLRVDRLQCKAVRQWQAGTKALQTSQRQQLEQDKQRAIHYSREAGFDYRSGTKRVGKVLAHRIALKCIRTPINIIR